MVPASPEANRAARSTSSIATVVTLVQPRLPDPVLPVGMGATPTRAAAGRLMKWSTQRGGLSVPSPRSDLPHSPGRRYGRNRWPSDRRNRAQESTSVDAITRRTLISIQSNLGRNFGLAAAATMALGLV